MDFDGAIQAHNNWKLRLLNYTRAATTEKIDLQALGADKLCSLGQWLHGEGQKYSGDPRFTKLRDAHSAFHVAAASVGALVEQGKSALAEAQLNSPDSEFSRLSFRVVAALMELRRKHAIA